MGYFMYKCRINPVSKLTSARAGLREITVLWIISKTESFSDTANQMKGAEMFSETSSPYKVGVRSMTVYFQRRWCWKFPKSSL